MKSHSLASPDSNPGAPTAPSLATGGAAAGAIGTGVKVRYGAAAFADNLAFNCVNQFANPIYNLILGVNPAVVGLMLAIPRVVDAFLDPFIGLVSDNHRSRWGRRRGFIAIGAILTGIAAASIWWPPSGQSTTFYAAFLLIAGLFLAVSHSLFTVPYYALGVELTTNDRDRNALMGWRAGFNKLSGVANQWLFALAQLAVFGGILSGARTLGIIIGVVVIGLGLLPALTLREPAYAQVIHQERQPFWKSFRGAFARRDFRFLAFSNIALLASVMMVDAVGFYLTIFQVCDGDFKEAGLLKGVSGTVFQVGGLISLPFFAALCRKYDKRTVARWSMVLVVVAGVSKWFCYFPGAGWWVVLPSALLAPGLAAVLMLGPSMLADLCDVDEAEHGVRREGMFVATFNWLLKFCTSALMLLSGSIIALTGFKASAGAAQSPETIFAMRLWFTGGTVGLAVLAYLLLGPYSLTAARLAAIRRSPRTVT